MKYERLRTFLDCLKIGKLKEKKNNYLNWICYPHIFLSSRIQAEVKTVKMLQYLQLHLCFHFCNLFRLAYHSLRLHLDSDCPHSQCCYPSLRTISKMLICNGKGNFWLKRTHSKKATIQPQIATLFTIRGGRHLMLVLMFPPKID